MFLTSFYYIRRIIYSTVFLHIAPCMYAVHSRHILFLPSNCKRDFVANLHVLNYLPIHCDRCTETAFQYCFDGLLTLCFLLWFAQCAYKRRKCACFGLALVSYGDILIPGVQTNLICAKHGGPCFKARKKNVDVVV